MSEAQLLRSVLDALRMLPSVCHALRLNAGATVLKVGETRRMIRGCESGTPDILVMLDGGRCVWLECKTDKGRVTETQKSWHTMAAALGHRVAIARSVEDAIAAVRSEARR